jgi:hypothetical protein
VCARPCGWVQVRTTLSHGSLDSCPVCLCMPVVACQVGDPPDFEPFSGVPLFSELVPTEVRAWTWLIDLFLLACLRRAGLLLPYFSLWPCRPVAAADCPAALFALCPPLHPGARSCRYRCSLPAACSGHGGCSGAHF